MTSEKILNHIRILRDKSEADKLIAFIGSGVSRNVAGMPSWHDLIVKMANVVNYSKCDTCTHKKSNCKKACNLKEEYTPDEFLKIPQYVANKNKKTYLKLIKDSFPEIQVDAPLSEAIFDIHPSHIITTNYDNLIETSKSIFRSQYELIVKDADLLNSNKNKYIIKMHGDLNDVESIVLKESDYLNYSQNHILIETFIKALLTDHTLLFLGYSISDYNIKLIISWINFMRSQNNAIGKNGISYLVSCKKISKSEEKYFKNNGIEIIYLKDMPLINGIPSEITAEEGKKLYSFLKVIANPNLEASFDYKLLFKDAVRFANQFRFVDLKNLLNLLYIYRYSKKASQLTLPDETDYNHLYEYLNSGSVEATQLKQLFINAGIGVIRCLRFEKDNLCNREYNFYEEANSVLNQNELFCLYLQNRYTDICKKIQAGEISAEDACFYMSIIDSYDESIVQNFSKINYDEITQDEKTAYLYNSSIIRLFTTGALLNKDLDNFINNCDLKTKNVLSYYSLLIHGNYGKINAMTKSLEKLKELYQPTISTTGETLGDLYEIQNHALNQYNFYFFNKLIFHGFSDLPNFLLPYIEAILCTNSEHSAPDDSFWGFKSFPKQKYKISIIDLDIITKYCDIKKLQKLFNQYNIEQLNCDVNTIEFAIEAFKNISESVIDLDLYSRQSPSLVTLINYGQILLHLKLNEEEKAQVNKTLSKLFSDLEFVNYFISHMFLDSIISLRILTQLISLTISDNEFSIIKNILTDEEFLKHNNSIHDYDTKSLITAFIPIKDKETQSKILTLISSANQIENKILYIFIFMEHFNQDNLIEIKNILQTNFSKISLSNLYPFILNGWVEYNQESTEKLISSALSNAKSFRKGAISPNPTEYDLELIYILHIKNIIKDISKLQPLSTDYPQLNFLLNPNSFDYSQVDFSNYMWQNFARTPKLLQKFIEHKNELTPKIKKRIELDEAAEFERKIYYKYLLSDEEIWRN